MDKADQYTQAVMSELSDGHWHSARSLCQRIPEIDKRVIRTIRDRSKGAVIGSQKGYRLTRCATKEETDAYIRMCYKNMREYQQTAVHVENFRARRRLA
jgi:hypothetical protein